MDEINYESKNIFDANKAAIKKAYSSAEEFIEIALDSKPKRIRDINLGNATDILGVTPGGADKLKKRSGRHDKCQTR
jgi:hypothetical protein